MHLREIKTQTFNYNISDAASFKCDQKKLNLFLKK